jgi:general secretion pathway protein M
VSAWRQRWDGLAPREQRVLQLGAVALGLIVGYLALWEPLAQSRDEWRTRVVAADADLAWMRAAAPQVRAARGDGATAPISDGRSLLARADASAREAGLGDALLRVEPVSANQVRVTFERAGFDAMMRWLEMLANGHGVRVGELAVQRADGVGLVDARVSLEQTSSL